jgi:phosphoribosylformylglycinamidine cyclo-ligase
MDYKAAGVDVEMGNRFVERIKRLVGDTYDDRVESGVGGFASLYRMDENRFLASGTDGVGTKLLLAQEINRHDTIGIDLVAMCANDVICTGARPLFFLDYLATGKLDLEIHTEIVKGIAGACKEIGCALIGGETAEMPGIYPDSTYDLAGFCVGEVFRHQLLGGEKVKANDYLVGVGSSGFHSNGFSLVRKLIKDHEIDLKHELLTPTRLYVNLVKELMLTQPDNIHGLSHITGGGFDNIPRMNEALGYEITHLPTSEMRSEAMNLILERSQLDQKSLYETFNMGIGMVVACGDPERLLEALKNERAMILGRVSNRFTDLKIRL